jgi:WD40 repeat protein
LATGLLALSLPVFLISCCCTSLGQGPAKVVATLSTDERASLTNVSFSSDGRTLAADGPGGAAHYVTIWDTATWKARSTVRGPDVATPLHFVLAPDGNHVAGLVADGLRIWDVPAGKPTLLPMEVRGTPDLTYSPDGNLIAFGAGQGPYALTLVDIAAGRTVAVPPVPGSANVVASSPDGQALAAEYEMGEPEPENPRSIISKHFLRLWDVPSRRQRADLSYGTSIITGIAFSPDGRYLATTDYGVRVWDLAEDPPTVRWQQQPQEPRFQGLAFSPDGRVLLVGNSWGEVKFLDAATGKELRTLKAVLVGEVSSLALSPDGRLLAVATSWSSIKVWDVSGILNASPK